MIDKYLTAAIADYLLPRYLLTAPAVLLNTSGGIYYKGMSKWVVGYQADGVAIRGRVISKPIPKN
jgi:hypothetical protein